VGNCKKISVIVPVYKVEKYLRECLDSIVNQTFKDIEIICVDDCGNDGSEKILEEYCHIDNRVKIVHNSENKGLAISRNAGMDVSSGDYIFFLDADDYILPETLEKLYQKAETSGADIAISKTKAFADSDTKDLTERVKITNQNIEGHLRGLYKITSENFITMATNLSVMSWGKLFSSKFIKENGLRFIEQNAIHEDVGFWLKACSCFPTVVSTEDIGVMYRIRSGSIISTHKRKKSKQDLISNLHSAFTYFDEKNKDIADDLKSQVKTNECFCSLFDKRIGFLYRERLLKDNKLISILGIPVYREKINRDKKKVYKVFGIKVYIKKRNCGKQ